MNVNISSEECFHLLHNFHYKKPLDIDGIPIEFYRTFYSLISESFVGCADECFEKGEMCHALKSGCRPID